VRAFSNCAGGGLLSSRMAGELTDAYRIRVEPLLETASFMQRTAEVVRGLVRAASLVEKVSRA
jgi:hypothetical protein